MKFVKLLVDNSAKINYQNEYGHSAFTEAIKLSEFKIAYYLLQKGADYTIPIFYRPDYSIPLEKQNINDKGVPVYILDILREAFLDFDTIEYKYKMCIVDYLKSKGIYYRKKPIPEYIKKKARKKYQNNWREYLKRY